jgi:hypothetical protein
MADPAHDEESNLSQINQDDAQPGDQDDQQTPGDPADARPEDESQTLESDGDDSLADSDPLALAQQESAPTPAKAAAVKAAPSPAHKPTITQPAKAAKTDDTPAADDDASLREALEDIPEDDWKNGRLTHKAKSQFLSQRKAIKRLNEQVAATKKVHEDLDAVEQLRRDQGLEPEEFVNAALLTGAMKRGDARAIPFLEQRLADLRKRAGIPDAQPVAPPQAPAFDPTELLAEINAAQANYDFERLDRIKEKLNGMAKGTAPTPPVQQPPQQIQPQANQQRQQVATMQAMDGEASEFNAMSDALSALGVANPVEHVRSLLSTHPDLAAVPAGQRLRAVLAKHREVESSRAIQPRRTTGQPLSGRGGPQRAAGGQTSTDPLKHARRQ